MAAPSQFGSVVQDVEVDDPGGAHAHVLIQPKDARHSLFVVRVDEVQVEIWLMSHACVGMLSCQTE